MQGRFTLFAACLAVAGMQPVAPSACGYDNPQAIALGSLNAVYPEALYVRTAVSEAEAAGLLPRDEPVRLGLFAFHRALAAMTAFGKKLADPQLEETGRAVSVVLIPQAMWTRFTMGPDGVTVKGHVEGPEQSDLVIVTEEKVVRALLDGKLDAVAAEDKGLVRYYGPPTAIASLRAALVKSTKTN